MTTKKAASKGFLKALEKSSKKAALESKDPERAAEYILEIINEHELSTPAVPKSVSKEFWETIIEHLKTNIDALGDDDE